MAEYALGLDIGGTSMVAGVISAVDGRILSRWSVPTNSQRGIDDGLQRIADLLARVLDMAALPASQMVGLGIGSTAPVDPDAGTINNPFTLPGWDGIPVVSYLSKRFDLPVRLLSDTQAAILGEHWIGAGKGSRHMVYVTVGTGIGGSLVLEGKLYRGTGFLAGEVGHHVLDVNGPPCYCGARGCWEMFAAGPAIAAYAAEHVPADSALLRLVSGEKARITAKLVSEAAVEGDPFSLEVMQRVGYYMGTGVGNLINIFAPEVVVLGGGVMQSWSMLGPIIQETVRKRSAMVAPDLYRIVAANLGLNAGITGAARAIFLSQEEQTNR